DLAGAPELYRELGDARAFSLVHEFFRLTQESVVREGGALVKTVGEGVLAVFSDAAAAGRVGAGLQGVRAKHEARRALRVRAGVHRGPALAATLNDHLDYFGATLSQAMRLPALAGGGELVLTAAVASDPRVAAALEGVGLEGQVEDGGDALGLLHRFHPAGG